MFWKSTTLKLFRPGRVTSKNSSVPAKIPPKTSLDYPLKMSHTPLVSHLLDTNVVLENYQAFFRAKPKYIRRVWVQACHFQGLKEVMDIASIESQQQIMDLNET